MFFFYKYKINKFSKQYLKTIIIDKLLSKFNGNDLELFNTSSIYRSLLYEFYKSNFNILSKTKDINGFSFFLQKNKIHKEIQDYLLSIYATNYFITDYSNPEKSKEACEYLLKILSDQECKNYIYKAYLKNFNKK